MRGLSPPLLVAISLTLVVAFWMGLKGAGSPDGCDDKASTSASTQAVQKLLRRTAWMDIVEDVPTGQVRYVHKYLMHSVAADIVVLAAIPDDEHKVQVGKPLPADFPLSNLRALFVERGPTSTPEDMRGLLGTPGGFLDPKDADLAETARRELREETGIDIRSAPTAGKHHQQQRHGDDVAAAGGGGGGDDDAFSSPHELFCISEIGEDSRLAVDLGARVVTLVFGAVVAVVPPVGSGSGSNSNNGVDDESMILATMEALRRQQSTKAVQQKVVEEEFVGEVAKVRWVRLDEIPEKMAFDHRRIALRAIEMMRGSRREEMRVQPLVMA